MLEGIRAALGTPADPRRMRIVAFLTDGYIGNEAEILAEVRRLLGDARLFAFGIGSSVNRYLLEGLAEEGRGEAAFLGPRESADAMVARFVKRIATPVLTDIRITWEDLEVEDLEPSAIPDLFAGQPLILHGRYRKPGTGLVVIEGRRGDVPVTLRRVVILRDAAADNEALARLWARARIHRLSRELYGGERHDVKEAITSLGLQYNLMTAWTSLVAVDSVVSNLTGSSSPVSVPVELPEDVSYEGIFGAAPQARGRSRLVGAVSMKAASSLGIATERFHSGPAILGDARESSDTVSSKTKTTGPDVEPPSSRFDRLILVEADGTRLIVEADGEVWRLRGRRRRLVRTLSAAIMEEIRSALDAARPERWTGGKAAPRLIFEAAGKTTAIGLREGDPEIDKLTSLIRRSAL